MSIRRRRLFEVWTVPAPFLLATVLLASIVLVACQSATPAAPTAAKAVTTAAAAVPATSAPAAPAAATTAQTAAPAPAAPAAPTAAPAAPTAAPAAPTAAPAAPTAAVRKPQGTLVVAVPTLGQGALGLPRRHDADTMFLAGNIMESLLRLDANGQPSPNLAEKWEVNPSGKITFYLRKGVQFHNGLGELTADDVKFSYEDVMRPDSIASGKSAFIRLIKSADVVDKYTVVFNVDPANAMTVLTAGVLQTPSTYLPITSKKYVESVGPDKAALNPIGTGPWKFVEFRAGDRLTLEAVENHWRQTPYFKTLTLREVPEMASLVAMLRAGDVDLTVVAADYRKELEGAGLKVIASKPGSVTLLTMGGMIDPARKTFDPTIPWVGDPKDATSAGNALKVRKAMNLAVNRQQIMDTILGGGTVTAVPWFTPGTKFYDPAWTIPYDPAQAKQLLKEAGYPDGFSFEILVTKMGGRPWLGDLSEAVAMQMEQNLGLKIKRTVAEYGAEIQRRELDRTIGRAIYATGRPPYVEPHLPQHVAGRTTGPIAIVPESKDIDGMLDTIVSEFDDAKRTALIRKLGQHMFGNYLTIPIGDVPNLVAVGKKVAEYRPVLLASSLYEMEYATPK